jgi:NADH:ubiquinone oxidoreductase subunit K
MLDLFVVDWIAVVVLFCIGLYIMIVTKNMLRILIGIEIIAKGVTLALITAGSVNGKLAFSQTLAITVIVFELVFVVIALAIVMIIQKNKRSLDIRELTKLKG